MELVSYLRQDNPKPTCKCSCCGKVFSGLNLYFGADYPNDYFSIPQDDRKKRIELIKSLYVVDENHCFHYGGLTIPIVDRNENLIFNDWTTINEDNCYKRMDEWEVANSTKQDPYYGWLQTTVPSYGYTFIINTIDKKQAVGVIPEIKSIEDVHRLTQNQKNGNKSQNITKIKSAANQPTSRNIFSTIDFAPTLKKTYNERANTK